MPVIEASGTQTATLTTEHTLATINTARLLVLLVDARNMVNGETLELKIKTRVLSGGTTDSVYTATYQHAQTDDPIKVSIPVPSMHQAIFTLKQTGGTGRAYDWAVLAL